MNKYEALAHTTLNATLFIIQPQRFLLILLINIEMQFECIRFQIRMTSIKKFIYFEEETQSFMILLFHFEIFLKIAKNIDFFSKKNEKEKKNIL